jgi:hypothetical protein
MRPVASRPLAAACLLVMTVLGGCGSEGPSGSRLDGLLLLAGSTRGTDLRAWTDQDAGAPIDVPEGTTWVSAGRADVLALILADGTLRISDPIRPDRDPTWQETTATLSTGDEAVGPFWFPVWDRDGGRLATVAGDFDADPRLTIVDPSAGTASEVELGRSVSYAPPTWVGPDLVAIVTETAGATGSVLVDTASGTVTAGPSGARLLATSADGVTLAAAESGTERIVVRSTKAWLDEGAAIIAIIEPPTDAVAAISMALDATGDRLAVTWIKRGETTEVAVAIYDGSLEWKRVAGPATDDAAGGVVAWFR